MVKVIKTIFMVIFAVTLVSCGGGGGSSSTTSSDVPDNTTDRTYGVAVDPYIAGAQFCIDTNANGTCDAGEELSSVSDANGSFYFNGTIPDGTMIATAQSGLHNGVEYALDLCAVYDENGDFVVSPITTMEANGFTRQQIADMLNHVGFSGMTADNVITDPMSGLVGNGGAIDSAKLTALRASLSAYLFQMIEQSSTALGAMTPQQIYDNVMSNGVAYQLMATISTMMGQTLNAAEVTTLTSQIPTGFGLPAASFSDVLYSAVAMTDKLAGIGMANANDGTYGLNAITAYLTTVGGSFNGGVLTMAQQLGMSYYFTRVEDSLNTFVVQGMMGAGGEMGTIFTNAHNCASGFYTTDTAGKPVCITTTTN